MTTPAWEKDAGLLGGLFEPDALLGAQFAATCRASQLTPEQRLMAAVLEQVIAELSNAARGGYAAAQRAEAAAWVRSPSREWPFAFAAICEAFGWDEQAARAALLELGARAEAEAARPRRVWREGACPR